MTASVLLLRGINVGGHGKLPMADLRAAIEAAGGQAPQTYIQSGNAVFRGAMSEDILAKEIEARAGFRPRLLLLAAPAFETVRASNPFPDETRDPKALHVGFLASSPLCAQSDLDAKKGIEERVVLTGEAVYLHTPRYLSASKLAPKLEALVGVPMTLRNWRTVEKLADMLGDLQ